MKKSLIALAVLAASGAAMAQSSVTLYGIADVYFGSFKNGLSSVNNNTGAVTPASLTAVKQTGLNPSTSANGSNGGLSTSRWGVRGTEDLGGGLRAQFNLEQGINVDSGTARGDQFDREAWVGLAGSFGDVRLGRTFTAYDQFRAGINANANSNMAITGAVFGAAGGDYSSNIGNHIRYNSPSFSGFSFGASYGFGENKTATRDAADAMAFHVRYASGPLVVGVAYQEQGNFVTTGTAPNTVTSYTGFDTSYTMIGGSYNFGVAAVTAGYNMVDRDAALAADKTEDNEYFLGVSVPLGKTTVFFGYADAETESAAGVTTVEASGFALHATYELSKRTNVYAGYRDAKQETGAGVKTGELNQVSVGIRHSF